MRIEKDQKWRRLEDGTMELIEEVEVEREIIEEISTEEEIDNLKFQLQVTQDAIDFLIMMGGM
jgi:hypothetical protein